MMLIFGISILLVLVALSLFVIMFVVSAINENYPKKLKKKEVNYAIIIPARDESNVIEGLLESISKQSVKVDFKDVYVVVENKNDDTVDIVNQYGGNVFVRKNLELRRKGYAIDEVIKNILKSSEYDAYFIFDADNRLDKDYIKEMLVTINDGYDIGIGYRNTDNGNTNAVSACSSLTFSMINVLSNKSKMKNSCNLTVSGTGFYISGKVINELNGYPFHSLTEDYELTLYSILNNLTSFYNEKAMFYDEQPVTMKESIEQRTRWVRGYFDARRKYIKDIHECLLTDNNNYASQFNESIGIMPYLLLVGAALLFLLSNVICALINLNVDGISTFVSYAKISVGSLAIYYFILCLVTLFIVLNEKDMMNLNRWSKIKAILFNPVFLATYIICLVKALLNPNLEWKKIKHTGKTD